MSRARGRAPSAIRRDSPPGNQLPHSACSREEHAIQLRYGSYSHAEAECTVFVSQAALENEAGQFYARRDTWTITGRLTADTLAALMTAQGALEAAYNQWYKDLYLYDGSTVVWQLPNRSSLTGVKITQPPSYRGEGAQLTTFLDYQITATADYPAGTGQALLRSFNETLAFAGGGPRRAVLECVNAPPQEQVLTAYTAYRATQTGSAVGMWAYPPIPAPLFPGKLEVEGQPTWGSPKLQNGQYTDWPVSWSYSFVSGTPLVGLPNRWPSG